MKLNGKPWYENLSMFLYCAALLLVTFCVLLSELTETDPFIQADVRRVNYAADTLQTFPKATILSAGKIYLQNVSTKMRYLAPRPHIDPIYAFLFFLAALIVVVFFRDFSYKNPFTKKVLFGLWTGCVLLIIFYIVNFFRYDWFSEQVKQLTNGQFACDKPLPLTSPEFWILLILIRLIKIYRQGVALQSDADLTV